MAFVALIGLVLVAAQALAGPTQSDVAVTADGGIAITTKLGSPVGPSLFDMATNGTAWAKFMWFKEETTGRAAADSANIVARVMVQLRDYTPPRSLYFPSGPDSVYIDLITATEVIVTR
jgi:tetrahydromethanopterin S-methyltransferase subunit H